MATTETYSGNFEGRKAAGYIAPALYGGRTLMSGVPHVTVHENIKYKLNVRNFDISDDVVQDDSCDFTPTSTITNSDTVLQLKELKTNLQLCFDKWYPEWEAEQIRGSRLDGSPPREWMDFLMDRLNARVANRIERLVWQGADDTNEFEGFISRLGAPDIVNTAITQANVLAEMTKIYNEVSKDVKDQRNELNVKMVVSQNVKDAHQLALAGTNDGQGYEIKGTVGEKPQNFMGFEFVSLPGLPDDTMIVYPQGDLHFGTNLLTDLTNVEVVDTRKTLADNNLRVVMRYAAGTQVTNRTNITYYGASIS